MAEAAGADRMDYLLLDHHDFVQARWTQPITQAVELQPWMQAKVDHHGWRLVHRPARPSGMDAHGFADWEPVAKELAEALRPLLANSAEREEDLDHYLEEARKALDNYEVARMEVAVASPAGQEPGDGGQ